ncbi:MAG: hypothetical protein MJ025_00085 [Victivallaceae bacterium]|nr:hypothetical protein [Victivallaceae bacterium]
MNRFNRLRLICFVLVIGATLYYPIEQVIALKRDAMTFVFTTREGCAPLIVNENCLCLDLETDRFQTTHATPERISIAYAILDRDSNGIARITDVVVKKADIPSGARYIKIYDVRKICEDNRKTEAYYYQLRLPFARYDLDKSQTATALRILSEKDKKHRGTITVKVYAHGYYSVEKISINGTVLK